LEAFSRSVCEGRYYDAHEDLEPVWYPYRLQPDNEVLLLKGLINAAVSFELIKRGRPKASLTAWGTYRKYRLLLETLETPHKELYVRITELVEKHHSDLVPSVEQEARDAF